MAEPPTFQELTAMRASLAELPGFAVWDEMVALDRSARVFRGNAREFARFLGEMQEESNLGRLWAVDNRENFAAFLFEVDRLLHNVVASAMSLRDHARRAQGKLLPESPDDTLAAEYRARVDQDFKDSPLAQFVQGLRNFTIHRSLPVTSGRLSWAFDGVVESRILLPSAELLE